MKTVEELRQIASDMTSDTNNVNKYLSESPRIANFLIGYDYASSRSMESQWIDVKERLPENEDTVLISNINTQSLTTTAIHIDGKFFMLELQQIADEVTHWMPLPQPPTK